MSAIALQFEAKKIAYRQTKDGVVVSLLCHPNDVPSELATAELGTVYMIRAQETESGAWEERASGGATLAASTTAPQRGEETAVTSKPHRSFSDLPLSQQCAVMCQDRIFARWLREMHGVDTDKEPVADYVRRYCQVSSRAELDINPEKATIWRAMNDFYEAWLTTQMHGDLVR